MARYRFDFWTTKHVRDVWEADYDDDAQAKVAAEGLLNAADPLITAVEVRNGTRIVCRIQRHG